MDKIREEFEACFPDERFTWNPDRNEYWPSKSSNLGDGTLGACLNRDKHLEIWKASRESLVVELPHMADYVNMLGQVDKCYSYLDDLHAAIHAAGIRTK